MSLMTDSKSRRVPQAAAAVPNAPRRGRRRRPESFLHIPASQPRISLLLLLLLVARRRGVGCNFKIDVQF